MLIQSLVQGAVMLVVLGAAAWLTVITWRMGMGAIWLRWALHCARIAMLLGSVCMLDWFYGSEWKTLFGGRQIQWMLALVLIASYLVRCVLVPVGGAAPVGVDESDERE